MFQSFTAAVYHTEKHIYACLRRGVISTSPSLAGARFSNSRCVCVTVGAHAKKHPGSLQGTLGRLGGILASGARICCMLQGIVALGARFCSIIRGIAASGARIFCILRGIVASGGGAVRATQCGERGGPLEHYRNPTRQHLACSTPQRARGHGGGLVFCGCVCKSLQCQDAQVGGWRAQFLVELTIDTPVSGVSMVKFFEV